MRGKQVQHGLLVGVLLIVICWLGSLIVGLIGKAQIAIGQAHSAQTDYQALEERKHTLEANIANLATPLGTDAAIRTAFGVARPGEEVIVVVPPATSTPISMPSWWQQLFNWF